MYLLTLLLTRSPTFPPLRSHLHSVQADTRKYASHASLQLDSLGHGPHHHGLDGARRSLVDRYVPVSGCKWTRQGVRRRHSPPRRDEAKAVQCAALQGGCGEIGGSHSYISTARLADRAGRYFATGGPSTDGLRLDAPTFLKNQRLFADFFRRLQVLYGYHGIPTNDEGAQITTHTGDSSPALCRPPSWPPLRPPSSRSRPSPPPRLRCRALLLTSGHGLLRGRRQARLGVD